MILGLIGCGKMGGSLLKGITTQKVGESLEMVLYSRTRTSAEILASDVDGRVADSLQDLVREADILVLGVKPNQLVDVFAQEISWDNKLIVSLAAGVSIQKLKEMAGQGARVVRVMPNTPSLIGEGASAYCKEKSVTDVDEEWVEKILSCVGLSVRVEESLMDAVTGVSGSGPGYVLTIIEALTDAGVQQGLPRPLALQLVCQTLKGTAMLVEQSGEHPAALRDQVTSPGGTTITGLTALEQGGLRATLQNAVTAATKRSIELG